MTDSAGAEHEMSLEAIRGRYRESMDRFGYPVLSWQDVEWLIQRVEILRRCVEDDFAEWYRRQWPI